jgi:hypothetical protein
VSVTLDVLPVVTSVSLTARVIPVPDSWNSTLTYSSFPRTSRVDSRSAPKFVPSDAHVRRVSDVEVPVKLP